MLWRLFSANLKRLTKALTKKMIDYSAFYFYDDAPNLDVIRFLRSLFTFRSIFYQNHYYFFSKLSTLVDRLALKIH